jgi:hypothetical protein
MMPSPGTRGMPFQTDLNVSSGDLEDSLLQQKERILFWATARLFTPTLKLSSGWYKLVSDISAIDANNKEEDLRNACRILLKRKEDLGFPCSYLSLDSKAIDLRVRFPSDLYDMPLTGAEGVMILYTRAYQILLLLHRYHLAGVTGVKFPRTAESNGESNKLDLRGITYSKNKASQRNDIRRYGLFLQEHANIDVLRGCIEACKRGTRSGILLKDHFHELTRGKIEKRLVPASFPRQVLPRPMALENLFEEAKRYPEDDCRFFFLAFDWMYRVAETLQYHTLPKDLISLSHSLLCTTPTLEEVEKEKRDNIILMLKGALVVEQMYDGIEGGCDALTLFQKVISRAIREPSEYVDYLEHLPTFLSQDSTRNVVRIRDIM